MKIRTCRIKLAADNATATVMPSRPSQLYAWALVVFWLALLRLQINLLHGPETAALLPWLKGYLLSHWRARDILGSWPILIPLGMSAASFVAAGYRRMLLFDRTAARVTLVKKMFFFPIFKQIIPAPKIKHFALFKKGVSNGYSLFLMKSPTGKILIDQNASKEKLTAAAEELREILPRPLLRRSW